MNIDLCRKRAAVLLATCLASMAFGTSPALSAPAPTPTVDPALPVYQPRPYTHPKDAGYLLPDGTIRIVGPQGMDIVFKNLNALFTQSHPEAKFKMELKGAATTIGGLYNEVSAFGPNVRQFWAAETSAFRMTFGYDPIAIKIGHGAFTTFSKANPIAIFVNPKNPIEKLTTEQVARIFSTGGGRGDITRWGQAGVTGEWAMRRVQPIGPSAVIGNIQGVAIFMKQDHFSSLPFATYYEEALSTAAVLKRVSEESNAIGFASFDGFQVKDVPNVKVLAIAKEGSTYFSKASFEDVVTRKYPYTRDIYIYVNRAPGQALNPFVKEYLRMVLSKQGQQAFIGQEGGFLPLDADEAVKELAKLD